MGRHKKIITSVEFIYCACGCGKTRPKYDNKGRECWYIFKHKKTAFWKGKKQPEELIKKRSDAIRGERNGSWKGNDVGIVALHYYVRKRLPKPELCMICETIPPHDLANITGIYNRELKNWAWFCHKCHMIYDNILERNLLRFNRLKHEKYEKSIQSENLICIRCNRSHNELVKKLKKLLWSKQEEGWLCSSCRAGLITKVRKKPLIIG